MDDYDAYRALIKKVSRQPMRPTVGITLFMFLSAISIFARRVLGAEFAGLVSILLLMVYPYYIVQLLMKWRMERHLMQVQRLGIKPIYVPSSSRGWAGVYIWVFFINGFLLVAIDKLFET